MGWLCRVASAKACLGIWTCQKTGSALRDLSWFIKIHWGLFPRVWALQDFLYPSWLHLAHHIKLWRTSDIAPLWGTYVEYPLPTECGSCAMATGISEKMGGPHIKDSLTPWTQTASPTSSCVCLFCNKSHNSRDSLVNHLWFHYQMVLVCPICGGCRLNQWQTVEGHIKKCAAPHPYMWTGKSSQGNHTGWGLTHHWWITLGPQKQRPRSHCQCGLIPQMMRRLHTEARSSNASVRSGKPKLLPSRRLQLQKLRRQTKSMMLWPIRMTASQPHQSQNDLSAIQRRRRSLPKGWSPSMTISMTTGPSQSQDSQQAADITPVDTSKKS